MAELSAHVHGSLSLAAVCAQWPNLPAALSADACLNEAAHASLPANFAAFLSDAQAMTGHVLSRPEVSVALWEAVQEMGMCQSKGLGFLFGFP